MRTPFSRCARDLRALMDRLFSNPLLRLSVLLAVSLVPTWPAAAQSDLSDLLSGSRFPLSTNLGSLDSSWRRVLVQSSASVRDNVSVNVSGNSANAVSQNNLVGALPATRTYLTKGAIYPVAGRWYLVAYHLPTSKLDLPNLLQAIATKTPPVSSVLTAETALPLCLLNIETVGHLEEIRAFDLQKEIEESERLSRTMADLFKNQSPASNSPPATNTSQTPKPPAESPAPEK